MAAQRTIQYWYNVIVNEKATLTNIKDTLAPTTVAADTMQSILDTLSTASRVAIWRLWAFITAVGMWIMDSYWAQYQIDVQNQANAAQYGTPPWWIAICLAYQDGFALGVQTNSAGIKYLGYADTTSSSALAAQVIKYASVTTLPGSIVIKVAGDSGGVPVALSSDIMARFYGPPSVTNYVNQVSPAGISVVAQSANPDQLSLSGTIYYNAQLQLVDVQAAVGTLFTNFLKSISIFSPSQTYVNYDGTLVLSQLLQALLGTTVTIDASGNAAPNGIQVPAIYDYLITSSQAKPATGSLTSFTRTYTPYAGYMVLADGWQSLFTWTPQ